MNNTPMIPLSQKARRYGATLLTLLCTAPLAASTPPSYEKYFIAAKDAKALDAVKELKAELDLEAAQGRILENLERLGILEKVNKSADAGQKKAATKLLSKKGDKKSSPMYIFYDEPIEVLREHLQEFYDEHNKTQTKDEDMYVLSKELFKVGAQMTAQKGKEAEKQKKLKLLFLTPGRGHLADLLKRLLKEQGAIDTFGWDWLNRDKNVTLYTLFHLLSEGKVKVDKEGNPVLDDLTGKPKLEMEQGKNGNSVPAPNDFVVAVLDKLKEAKILTETMPDDNNGITTKVWKNRNQKSLEFTKEVLGTEDGGYIKYIIGGAVVLSVGSIVLGYLGSKLGGKSEGDEGDDYEEDDETGEDEGEEDEDEEGLL